MPILAYLRVYSERRKIVPMREADKQMLADHYLDLYQMAYSMLGIGADAEDAVHDALVATMTRHLWGDPYKYCVATLRNICIKMKQSNELLLDIDLDVANPEPDTGSRRLHRLLDLVEALPERNREILYLYYGDGYSKAEIAKKKGLSETMVKKLFKKGQEKLKKQLLEIEMKDKDIFKP